MNQVYLCNIIARACSYIDPAALELPRPLEEIASLLGRMRYAALDPEVAWKQWPNLSEQAADNHVDGKRWART
jgi:hypothetical protein